MIALQQYHYGLGAFGAAGASVYSGPPVGAGARGGATVGAMQGATVGAIAGPVGAAIGAAIGAIGGAIAGSINKRDPEQANFDQAVAVWQQNRLSVLNLANLYLPLAGLFDLSLKNPHIPIYQKYGRMGEQKFVMDMMTKVYNAAQSGQITASDTPQTIMVKVVQPWIDSWGFGPMADPHSDLINLLMMGMIADYVSGNQTQWKARGGDYPFGSLPAFSLPGGTTASTAASYAPNSAVAAAPLAAVQTPTPTAVPTPVATALPTPAAVPTPVAVPTPAPTSALANNPFPGWNPGTPTTDPRLSLTWTETENNTTTVWTPAGGIPVTGFFTAVYPGANARLQVLLSGTRLLALRQDSDGEWVAYQGTVGPDLQSVSGTATYYSRTAPQPIQYAWSATIPGGAAALSSAPAAGTSSSSTTVPVPAGYQPIGTANGLSAYQGLDGNYYSWNGVAMSPLTGTLTASNGMSASVVNGQVQPAATLPGSAPTTLTSPPLTAATQQMALPAAIPSYQSYAGAPAPLSAAGTPAIPAPTTAGVNSAGLPSWLTWGAVAAAAYFMFATARPVGPKHSAGKAA